MSVKQILTTLMIGTACLVSGSLARAADIPGQVSLDTMVGLFGAVEFDHAMHADLGEDCSVCHHHTVGTGTTDERCVRCHAESPAAATVSCRDCHVAKPFSAEHIDQVAKDVYQFHFDKPGLKAAYHWNCMGCHKQMDGPMGCQDCHARTAEGDAFYRASASVAPQKGGHGR